jgi:hypothetical protein
MKDAYMRGGGREEKLWRRSLEALPADGAFDDAAKAPAQVTIHIARADAHGLPDMDARQVTDAHQEIDVTAADVQAGCDLAAVEKDLFHVRVPKVGWLYMRGII